MSEPPTVAASCPVEFAVLAAVRASPTGASNRAAAAAAAAAAGTAAAAPKAKAPMAAPGTSAAAGTSAAPGTSAAAKVRAAPIASASGAAAAPACCLRMAAAASPLGPPAPPTLCLRVAALLGDAPAAAARSPVSAPCARRPGCSRADKMLAVETAADAAARASIDAGLRRCGRSSECEMNHVMATLGMKSSTSSAIVVDSDGRTMAMYSAEHASVVAGK
mmetsp:Transcript_41961/g.125635  ORF Transcript_41961/g.125635 Transcript_41961/m.125635 type:complete len:220 (+) Transcript_41961:2394-3053(+)